jgi:dipeptidyl aminopeptidase/acylaminoacyl peptidase
MNPEFGGMGATADYDPQVQFLASRGYAVLRFNPRGTPGYGKAFFDAGKRQQGLAVQDDVTDGVRWAIAKGLADPRRIGVCGSRFGGFSAEWALIHEPGLYRCGVTIDGICDLKPILGYFDSGPGFLKKVGYSDSVKWVNYVQSQMGDPTEDAAMIRDVSPINRVEGIRAPILVLAHRKEYLDIFDQSKEFANALRSHGVSHEYEVLPEAKTVAETRQQWEQLYTLVGSFLDRNLK